MRIDCSSVEPWKAAGRDGGRPRNAWALIGLDAARRITAGSPRIPMLTTYDSDESVFNTTRPVARRYWLKDADHEDLIPTSAKLFHAGNRLSANARAVPRGKGVWFLTGPWTEILIWPPRGSQLSC